MQNDAKVVPLKVATDPAPNTPLARLPVALLQVRDIAVLQFRQGLQLLFDNADDTLFELADKARTSADQSLFLQAMRDLRLERKSIERGFIQLFNDAFVRIGQVAADELDIPRPPTFDRLTLVSNDELEQTVALDAMVAKVLARDGVALGQLTRRFNVLLGKPLDDHDNPLGPALLCDCFLRAGRSHGMDLKVKLIVLKLFENAVLRETGQLYGQANQLLGSLGVLPELKALPDRRAGVRSASRSPRPVSEAVAEPSSTQYEEGVQAVFTSLRALLSPARVGSNPGAPASLLTSHDLMRLLTHLQHSLPISSAPSDCDVRGQLEQLLAQLGTRSGMARRIGEVEDDVITLVSLLFKFIASDRNLPDSLKRPISRLQIPLLKVALLDKSLFSRGNHPARRLLNEMASAAIGLGGHEEYSHDGLCLRIEQIAQRLNDEFVDDPSIFSELLADFLAFSFEERRRSELLEQRTRDGEEGRAKAEQALLRVEHELNRRLHARILPQRVIGFIEAAWSKVLLLAWLKHGEASVQWQHGLSTLDDLIWSVEPHADAESRLRLLEVVPGLLKSLREGLAGSAFDPFATREFFSDLEALHVQAFECENEGGDAPTRSDSDIQQLAVVDEISLGTARPATLAWPRGQLADDDAALLQVDLLRPGVWVEIQEDAEHSLRCKLATLIEASGKYIFVNCAGLKVLEKTRMDLALEFHHGQIRVLDEALLFDRALTAVARNLRQHKDS
ncbi:DUF1631 domain-containing protein [Pseudomonas sp. LS1212]|uniref:DUF1631 domain-containing protein n=1 Tax=Pseudomonas sp. LS1212 TaxID=2972478 RepID=UPI00215C7849|nr:DUF1631 domain-containing protein [Pseudomonas sp. LS1212]UVJ43332.1 DUF1631 domain-containing protein [Pseudomonas sp. LS1212]